MMELASCRFPAPITISNKREEYRRGIVLNSRNKFHQPLGAVKTLTKYLGMT